MRAIQLIFFILSLSFATLAPAQQSCRQAQEEARIALIQGAEFGEMVLLRPDGFVGIYLGGAGHGDFMMTHFSTWSQVENFYRGISYSEKHFLTNLMTRAQMSLRRNYLHLDSIAKSEGVELRYRLKDLSSIKEKIVDRILNFPKEKGRGFKVQDLIDVMGFRLILPMNSPLLHLSGKAEWARVLKLPEGSIVDIRQKGSEEDTAKGRYYTAIHLEVRGADGQVFEIQVMSKAMAVWHKWDHPLVYKGREADPHYSSLEAYSAAWAKVIHDLTPFSERSARSLALAEIAASNGVLFYSGFSEVVPALDRAFRERWSLTENQGLSQDEIQSLGRALN
jgi:ppGpp synthetase/RelA/SpoT-type nucleotidyltranferase